MSASHNSQEEGVDFIRRMWGNMGFGLPGMVTPTLDVDELERRIKDLQAVEGWLKMNLGMLQMTIQGLEVQCATLHAMQSMSNTGADGEPANPFANPALWNWPFGQSATSAPRSSEDSGPAAAAKPDNPAPDNTGKP